MKPIKVFTSLHHAMDMMTMFKEKAWKYTKNVLERTLHANKPKKESLK